MQLSPEEIQSMDIGQPMGLPISEKSKNRLYLSWRNAKNQDCKMIGPETKCFCNHKFKDHEYLNNKTKKVPCKDAKCKCKNFDYVPSHGAYDFKCLCKHSFKEHDCITKKCNRQKCQQCKGFGSAWTCPCSSKYGQHQTIVQTFEQRKANGRATNDMGRMYNQLNHLTEQGSLYKPIKMDPEQRAKKRWSNNSTNNPYLAQQGYSQKNIKEEEQLEEFNLPLSQKKRYKQ